MFYFSIKGLAVKICIDRDVLLANLKMGRFALVCALVLYSRGEISSYCIVLCRLFFNIESNGGDENVTILLRKADEKNL